AIKSLDAADRPSVGKAVGVFKSVIGGAIEARRTFLRDRDAAHATATDRLGPPLGGPRGTRGAPHPLTPGQPEHEDIFVGMGYTVMEGPEVEDDWHNFEALNMAPAHPARSMQDTLYVELGEPEQVLLRTHTSPVQIRTMELHQPPIYIVAPGRVYRNETPSPR